MRNDIVQIPVLVELFMVVFLWPLKLTNNWLVVIVLEGVWLVVLYKLVMFILTFI